MTYKPQPIREEGNQKEAVVSDDNTRELLKEILTVLKKIEYHLSIASDTELKDQDV